MGRLFYFMKTLIQEIINDKAFGLAAQQAFFYLLSLFPMIILILSILPYLNLDVDQVFELLGSALPESFLQLIQDNVIDVITTPQGGLLTFGIIGTIWTASNGVNAFMEAANTAFNLEETRSFIVMRLLSIALTLALIFALVVTLVLSVFGNLIIETLTNWLNIERGTALLLNVFRWTLLIVIVSSALSFLYYFATSMRFPLRHVIPGALIATILWQGVSFGFSVYISNFGNFSATYGSLGGIIVLMLWLYLTGFTFIIGGEVNALLHRHSKLFHSERSFS